MFHQVQSAQDLKPDGSRRMNHKSDFIIDGMAQSQSLTSQSLTTFNDVGEQILKIHIQKLNDTNEAHIVFDHYDDYGINSKQQEKFARYGCSGHAVQILYNRHQRDLEKYSANKDNKFNVNNLFYKYLQEYIAGGLELPENQYLVSKNVQYEDLNLSCNEMDAA